MTPVSAAIRDVLLERNPAAKVMRTRALVRSWRTGALAADYSVAPPDRPPLPEGLEVLAPRHMPRRGRGGSDRARIALWHALAHIEYVAIDLALDIVARFGGQMPRAFTDDFLGVAADEAMHFALIARKLRTLGTHYGALPAHGGLWDAAEKTKGSLIARLAVVPMVLEARGLDVTPATRDRVRASGDERGARILQRILDDEIRHVGAGAKHFRILCAQAGKAPESEWRELVAQHFGGAIKPPFNDSARLAAGLSPNMYTAVA